MDTMIANPVVSAVDDGTMPNQWGSINIDDEGMPTQKTQLIKNGKLTNFLVDKVGNLKTGHPRSGSGRKQNYKFAPASRMRNTFIEPGDSSLDEMIGSVDRGIYCKKMGGGSVSPGTGEFNFAAQETYLIENGKTIGYQVYRNGKFKKTFETLVKTFTKNRLISNRIFTPLYLTYSEQLNTLHGISQLYYPFLKGLHL